MSMHSKKSLNSGIWKIPGMGRGRKSDPGSEVGPNFCGKVLRSNLISEYFVNTVLRRSKRLDGYR